MQALPKSTGWVCAPTYPDLHDFVMPAVFQCLPEHWIEDWSAQYFTLRLINGATCAFRSLDDFANRIDPRLINRRQIEALAAGGAFDSIVPERAARRATDLQVISLHAPQIVRQAGILWRRGASRSTAALEFAALLKTKV